MVVGSAWMPWLRPMRTVSLCSIARAFRAARTRSMSASSRSLARTSCTFSVVSSTSLLVMPWCTKRAWSAPTCSARCVRKAMTSCLVTASISSMRATSNWTSRAFQTASAFSRGITPRSAWASQAWASISYQMRNLVSGTRWRPFRGGCNAGSWRAPFAGSGHSGAGTGQVFMRPAGFAGTFPAQGVRWQQTRQPTGDCHAPPPDPRPPLTEADRTSQTRFGRAPCLPAIVACSRAARTTPRPSPGRGLGRRRAMSMAQVTAAAAIAARKLAGTDDAPRPAYRPAAAPVRPSGRGRARGDAPPRPCPGPRGQRPCRPSARQASRGRSGNFART